MLTNIYSCNISPLRASPHHACFQDIVPHTNGSIYTTTSWMYLDELCQILEVHFVVDSQLVIPKVNMIMLDFLLMADAQRVVAWKIIAFSQEKQPIFSRDEQIFSRLARDLTVKPSTT